MKRSQQKRWLFDAALFGIFLSTFFLDLTGLPLHQFIGIAAGAAAAWHLLAHGKWVRSITCRFFGCTSNRARLYWLLDASLLAGFGVILVTGLATSTWLNLALSGYDAWHTIHVAASVITLGILVLKIAMHASWIISGVRGFFSPQPARTPIQVLQPVPVPAVASPDRRALLQLMGIVGSASLIALGVTARSLSGSAAAFTSQSLSKSITNPAGSSASIQAGPTTAPTSQPVAVPTQAPVQVAASSPQQPVLAGSSTDSSAGCTVLCSRGCSYPGQCRRYVDNNGNNLCDNGECL